MNGYFQLDLKPEGVNLILYPQSNDGKILDYRELANYLDQKAITYDNKILLREILSLKEQKVISISSQVLQPINEHIKVSMDENKTKVIARFYSPSVGGVRLTSEDVLKNIIKIGVKYGVKAEVIDAFIKQPRYCTDIELAAILPPVDGKSAKITYHFNTDLSRKPKVNEDGTVDFHQLETFSRVQKGDILATLEPAVQGTPGIDLYGNPIRPHKVEKKILRHGRNIHLSDDGLLMYSDVSGHATVIDNKVFVEDTYEVAGDVDTTTGDIRYSGNVNVKGSVRSGYTIIADGDIEISEVVEGAVLIAGGQIILKRGIQGMYKGKLQAQGNIITKFIENATVSAGGYVATESILHSNVTAKGDVIVNGKRGFITGGEIRSGTMISAKTVGSKMSISTLLEVGTDPALTDEYRALETEITELKTELSKIHHTLLLCAKKLKAGEKLPMDKIGSIRNLSTKKEENLKRIDEIKERQEKLDQIIDNNQSGRIKIYSMIYPGCKVVIANSVYFVRTELSHCTLIRDGIDVKVGAL